MTTHVNISKIEVKPQVRTVFDDAKLHELAASIKEHGILEPLIVHSKSGKDTGYVLDMGERRFRAAQLAGLEKVPVIISKEPIAKRPVLQLVENLQRENMNDMDLAEAFKKVMDEQSMNIDQLATQIGKTKGFVKQRLTLLKAAPRVQEAIRRQEIEFSAARALCGLPVDEQGGALEEAIKEENEARAHREEKQAKMLDLPGIVRPEIPEDLGAETAEETRKPRQPKKKPEPKAKTSTVKRVTRRRKKEARGAQLTSKPIEERLEEKTKEWVAGFIDDDTKGKGLDESLSATQARNLLKRYTAFLLSQRALIVR